MTNNRQNEWHELWVRKGVRKAFRAVDLDFDVRGFVVMADRTSKLAGEDRRKITDVDGLERCLRTVAGLGDDGKEVRRWHRLNALAAEEGWVVGGVTTPTWSLH